MFFEGSEKKIEMIFTANSGNLLERPHEFWDEVVDKCNASILSMVENEHCKAFLLSESSLFVWKDKILMLTCGQTRLADSVLYFLKDCPDLQTDFLIYQRKNEYQSQLQPSSFMDDVYLMKEFVPGKSWRFGHIHGHHNLLFHLDQPYQGPQDDFTTEFLIYDIHRDASDILIKAGPSKQEVRDYLKVEEYFPDFVIDDFGFEPFGYSLNAINDDRYFTIHITPQENSSYISFETNIEPNEQLNRYLRQLTESLRPSSFDLMSFDSQYAFQFQDEYQVMNHTQKKLSSNLQVDFRYYYKINETIDEAFEIKG